MFFCTASSEEVCQKLERSRSSQVERKKVSLGLEKLRALVALLVENFILYRTCMKTKSEGTASPRPRPRCLYCTVGWSPLPFHTRQRQPYPVGLSAPLCTRARNRGHSTRARRQVIHRQSLRSNGLPSHHRRTQDKPSRRGEGRHPVSPCRTQRWTGPTSPRANSWTRCARWQHPALPHFPHVLSDALAHAVHRSSRA